MPVTRADVALLRANDPRTPLPEVGVSPQPHADLPVRRGELVGRIARDTPELLQSVGELIARFVVLPSQEALIALQLFVLHTWAIEAAYATPYLAVVSAEKQSGKTKLLEVLELVVREPWLTASASESALFRTIEADCPTLLLDEVDAIFGSNTDRTEPLRALLNAGNKSRTTIARCVPPKFETRKFSTFCPKILSGIDTGRLPETITDRAITLHMKRRHAGEQVDRLRYRFAFEETEQLREQLREWAAGSTDELSGADPRLPDVLSDRAGDAWEPLFAIADHAGGEWGVKARDAAAALSGQGEDSELGRGAQLLEAIRVAMGDEHAIATTELLEKVNADEELPFGGWRDGRGLDGRGLSRTLKPYGVERSKNRFGDKTAWGYRREHFADVWPRYLPSLAVAGTRGTTGTASSSGTEEPNDSGLVPDVPDVPALTTDGQLVPDGDEILDPDTELERLTAKFSDNGNGAQWCRCDPSPTPANDTEVRPGAPR